MLWTIVVILLILWLLGAFVANLGAIVHLLLVIAVILVIYNLLTRGRATI
ncbi:MAG TPA: lmo0937 family membrane protein [Chloroflexota bacterium]